MRNSLKSLVLFFSFLVLFSALTGCGGPTESSPANSETAKKSEYPPLSTVVAQAEMTNLDGSKSKVADYKGKVLLLNMWATWCGPCRGEMPTLVKMQNAHRDKGFEIIGLNTDDGDTKEMVEDFAKEMNLNYTLVWAPTDMQNGLLKISNFGGIPQSFVVDREGNLRGVFRGGGKAELRKMEELVAKIVNGDDAAYVPADEKPASEPEAVDVKPASTNDVKGAEKAPAKSKGE